MFRVLTPILNLILALTIGGIFQAGVTLNVQTPAEVTAGTEFEVTVSINKGDLESFSRLQQNLPAGLMASAYRSSNADFSFDEKRVRFIWLRLPHEQDIQLVYKIRVDERLKGTFNIDSKFSYIDDNERKSVSSISNPIVILPSPDIDPELIVDIEDFEDNVIPYIQQGSAESQMLCVRQRPIKDQSEGGYIVNLFVNKEARQKFAKIEESVPPGYKAETIDSRESIFTFKKGTAKFLWMNLPSDPYFLVSYKLVPTTASASEPLLSGKFSFLEGEKTVSLDIKQTDMDLASVGADQIPELIRSASTPRLAEATITEEQVVKTVTEPEQVAEEKPPDREVKQPRNQTREPAGNKAYMLEPEEGIYYRVQLAAGHKSVDIRNYFKKYNLDKEVRTEFHEGWHKYSIGSFPVYKEARDYRVHIWNTTVIDDAFVSAYNNGQRITVQEALMIANQQWYK